jgi:hypothetical protein
MKISCSVTCGFQAFLSAAQYRESHGPHETECAYVPAENPSLVIVFTRLFLEFVTYQKALTIWVMTLGLRMCDG